MVERRRSKAYREIARLKEKLEAKTQESQRYKKRWQRLKKTMSSTCSPRSKADKLLAGGKCTNRVRRALIYHHTLVDAIRKGYMSQKSAKQRQMIAKLTSSLLLKKYRLQKHAQKSIGYDCKDCSMMMM